MRVVTLSRHLPQLGQRLPKLNREVRPCSLKREGCDGVAFNAKAEVSRRTKRRVDASDERSLSSSQRFFERISSGEQIARIFAQDV
jgi:hypothetical protein